MMSKPKKSNGQLLGEMHTNIEWIKDSLNKKAGKWTEKVLITLMVGTCAWALNQLLNLIPTAHAFITRIL